MRDILDPGDVWLGTPGGAEVFGNKRPVALDDALTVEKDNDKEPVIALREIADETISIDEVNEDLVKSLQRMKRHEEEQSALDAESDENLGAKLQREEEQEFQKSQDEMAAARAAEDDRFLAENNW